MACFASEAFMTGLVFDTLILVDEIR